MVSIASPYTSLRTGSSIGEGNLFLYYSLKAITCRKATQVIFDENQSERCLEWIALGFFQLTSFCYLWVKFIQNVICCMESFDANSVDSFYLTLNHWTGYYKNSKDKRVYASITKTTTTTYVIITCLSYIHRR